jgi:hypothetical protein
VWTVWAKMVVVKIVFPFPDGQRDAWQAKERSRSHTVAHRDRSHRIAG